LHRATRRMCLILDILRHCCFAISVTIPFRAFMNAARIERREIYIYSAGLVRKILWRLPSDNSTAWLVDQMHFRSPTRFVSLPRIPDLRALRSRCCARALNKSACTCEGILRNEQYRRVFLPRAVSEHDLCSRNWSSIVTAVPSVRMSGRIWGAKVLDFRYLAKYLGETLTARSSFLALWSFFIFLAIIEII